MLFSNSHCNHLNCFQLFLQVIVLMVIMHLAKGVIKLCLVWKLLLFVLLVMIVMYFATYTNDIIQLCNSFN